MWNNDQTNSGDGVSTIMWVPSQLIKNTVKNKNEETAEHRTATNAHPVRFNLWMTSFYF